MNIYIRLACTALLAVSGFSLAGCEAQKDLAALRPFLNNPPLVVSTTEYRVLPPDVLKVTSHHMSEVDNVMQQVRPDGRIDLPLLGEIMVADKTPKEIEESIKESARTYYQGDVDATVQIVGYNSQWIYVFGQVAHQGPTPYTGADTVLNVLAKSTPNDLAWIERIRVVRGSHPQTGGCPFDKNGKHLPPTPAADKKADQDGKPHILLLNLKDMIVKGDLDQNILLLPNDVIYVEPTPLAAIGLAVQQLLLPVRPAAEMASTPASVANPYNMLSGR